MKKRFAVLVIAMIAASAVLAGCGGKSSGGSGSGSGSAGGSGSGEEPYGIEKPYPAITPESANEKKAVANAQAALDGYIKNSEAGNKQNNLTNPIFRNEKGYKPRFVGYGFTVFSPKAADGTFRTVEVAVFDGTQVKPYSIWERFGSANKGDGKMNDSYYAGISSTYDPASYLLDLKPESAGEKAALAAVQAWAKKNLDPSLSQIRMTGYMIEWGEAEERPNMMMSAAPDGNSYGSVVSWEKTP